MRLPRGSAFLFGPRGTGKSTWVSSVLPDALRIDRLEAIADARATSTIIIDEVQKLPSPLDEVHRLIEHRAFRFAAVRISCRAGASERTYSPVARGR